MIDKKITHRGPVSSVSAPRRTQGGFTLIETLVAVMILASAIVGPLSIASRSLNNSIVAKDQISAFFLAQDAVEYTRFVRDSNRLKGADWLDGSGGSSSGVDLTPCTTADGCYFDSTMAVVGTADVPTVCTTVCPVMYYDSTNSRFTYVTSGNTATLFTRQVVLVEVVPDIEYKLTVTVSWSDLGSVTRRVVVYENIFKWQ
ncbi:MAG: prepilin-type N-terminal cleavage/methylation domain-containing protein [Patescibacteria group bacterium]